MAFSSGNSTTGTSTKQSWQEHYRCPRPALVPGSVSADSRTALTPPQQPEDPLRTIAENSLGILASDQLLNLSASINKMVYKIVLDATSTTEIVTVLKEERFIAKDYSDPGLMKKIDKAFSDVQSWKEQFPPGETSFSEASELA